MFKEVNREEKANEIKEKKIKDNESKIKENNELIGTLITKFNVYLKGIKNGLKVNKFFSEFDGKIGTDLKALV